MSKTTFTLLTFFLIGCVSRTVSDERFRDSQAIAGPTLNVSLADSNQFSFAIVGDLHVANQDTSRFQRILTAAQAEADSFIVLLGDIVDKGERADIVAVRSAIVNAGYADKYLPVIGNHDIFSDGWGYYKELNGGSHYSVTIGNSRFIALDTADGTVGKEQYDWLRNELKHSGSTNTFLLSHYLPVIPGQRTYLKLANEDEAVRMMRLATNFGVRAWLGAHYHSYITEQIEGVDYVVAGGGGGRRMEPVKDFFFVQVLVNGSSVSYRLRTVE